MRINNIEDQFTVKDHFDLYRFRGKWRLKAERLGFSVMGSPRERTIPRDEGTRVGSSSPPSPLSLEARGSVGPTIVIIFLRRRAFGRHGPGTGVGALCVAV